MKLFTSSPKEKSSRRSFLSKATLGISGAMLATSYNGLAASIEKTPMSSAPSDLKITAVKCGFIRNEHSLFVKIYTNQDIVGHGQGVDGVYGTYYVVNHIAQNYLIGKNPLNINRLQEEMRRGGFCW